VITDDVRALIELFTHSDLTELSVEQRGRRLFLRKGHTGAVEEQAPPAPEAPRLVDIRAHMVGIFYWSKDKDAKPAVKLQQHVDKGQVVGAIEAMDIMNDIESDQPGRVVEIAITSGQPVEYGQTVLVLEPDAHP
jgi:biotin carboxyl carrier protein